MHDSNTISMFIPVQDGDVPSVRSYQEAIMARFIMEDLALIDSLLVPMLKQFSRRSEFWIGRKLVAADGTQMLIM